jgi:hypothetical protein
MITVAEVIDTSIAFKKSPNERFTSKGDLPLGSIRVRTISKSGPFREFYAAPAWNINYVPCIGEHVLLVNLGTDISGGTTNSNGYYYLGPVSIQGNVNLNPLPDIFVSVSGNNYLSGAAPINNQAKQYTPGKNFKENATVKTLQPFEGDILFQGRHGQAIRFSSTQAGDTSQYAVTPFWQGSGNSPITIISNGHKPESGPNRFVIEDPNTTKSFLILSTNQRIRFNTSQQSIGVGVTPIGNYSKSQAILSSERLIFNSTEDEIIICGKKTVNVVTPKWQMDMDKLFTLLEQTLQQLADLTSGKAQFQTPMGGPTLTATNVTEVQKLLTELKTMKQ